MPEGISSWADEIDETDTSTILPPPSEKWVGNQKITTEYSLTDDNKKVNYIRMSKLYLCLIMLVSGLLKTSVLENPM